MALTGQMVQFSGSKLAEAPAKGGGILKVAVMKEQGLLVHAGIRVQVCQPGAIK